MARWTVQIACRSRSLEAFPWDEAPRCLIRDRDTSYGVAVTRRLRAMGIRDRPISPRSPWQNGHVERLIGSIRRECLDHVVALGEGHVRHLLANYQAYYNGERTTLRSTRMLRSVDHADSWGYRINPMARWPPSSIHSDGVIGRHRWRAMAIGGLQFVGAPIELVCHLTQPPAGLVMGQARCKPADMAGALLHLTGDRKRGLAAARVDVDQQPRSRRARHRDCQHG